MLNVSNKNKYILTALGNSLKSSALITFLILFFNSAISFAGTSMPSTFTYQGRLMDSSGTVPLAANLTLFIEVRSPTGSCLLYSERQSVNTTTTAGLFSIQIGNGTRNIAQAGYSNDPGYEFAEIFTNKQDFPTVAGSCPGGWTPGATDARVLRIHVYDGSTTTTLADQTLSPVPQSLVADTIDGVPLTGLTLNWVTATRPANPVTGMHGYNDTLGRFEKWNGAAWVPTTPKFSAAVINDTATDNYVLKWNDTSNVWEPSDIGTLLGNPGGDVSGTYSNMTVEAVQGQPVATTAPNLNEVLKWNGTEWEAAPDASLTAGTNTDQYLKWDGNSWEPALVSSLLSPDRSQNVAINNAGVITASSTYTVANNADLAHKNYVDTAIAAIDGLPAMTDAQIVVSNGTTPTAVSMSGDATISNAGALTIANNAITSAKINNGAILFEDIAANGCTGTQTLARNSGNTAWECITAPTTIHRTGGDATYPTWYFVNTTAPATIPSGAAGNLAIGRNSLAAINNDSADDNTAIGDAALEDNTSGSRNTALGANPLSNNTTGSQNIAIGSAALFSSTTSSKNIVIGNDAMLNNNSGGSNIIIGTQAAGGLSGTTNVGIGEYALGSATTADYNTTLGTGTLFDITTGDFNVAIGHNAGRYASAASAGNIFIGYTAGPTSSTAVTNKLYIDNSANNTPLIYGDFTDNYVRINNIMELPEIATPADAASGYGRIYFKSDGLYIKMGSTESKLVTGSGAGEVNTASSLGGTASLVGTKSGVDLRFRGLTGSANITVTENANDVTIAATGLQTSLASGTNTDHYLRWDGSSWQPEYVSAILSPNGSQNLSIANSGVLTASSTYTVANNADLAHKTYVDTAVAAIDGLPAMTDAQIVVSNGTTPAAVSMSGDATIANNGAVTIATSAVTTGKISNDTILFEDIAANGCTADQYMGRNTGNTAWECKNAGSVPNTDIDAATPFETSIGYNAGNAVAAGGLNNTFFGYGAGDVVSTGDDNIAIGVDALGAATTGSSNVAIGSSAGLVATGSDGIYIGKSAGDAVTSGTKNILIGTDAGGASTTSTENVAIGYQALLLNTTGGGYNVAIGSTAMRALNTPGNGRYNVAVGAGAMYGLTEGENNTAIGTGALGGGFGSYVNGQSTAVGANALNVANSGSYAGNDAYGYNSLPALTTGADNIGLGKQTLYNITTGGTNTAIGRQAGYYAATSSSGNVYIGYAAGPTTSTTQSNKLYIDNSANNTPLIGGDFSTNELRFEGNVGIKGAASATMELDVNGDIEADAYYYTSDKRLKKNISTLESPLEKLLKLRGVEFDWIKSGKHELGLIAQEVEQVYPDLVYTSAENGMKSVKYGNLVAPLIGAVQELNTKCEMRAEQMASIDERVKNVERKIASIEQKDLTQDFKIEQLRRENEELKNQINELKRLIKK